MDVDGTMTDGRIDISEEGVESKAFNVRDGLLMPHLLEAGVMLAIISGRKSAAVVRRAKELGITEVHQGVANKVDVLAGMCDRFVASRPCSRTKHGDRGRHPSTGGGVVDLALEQDHLTP